MGYKILGVTLARSGSKGVKQKNIKNLCGHPLLSYTIYAAKKSKLISRYVVSTNSKKFKNICLNYGADVPFLRPEKLSKDNVWSRDALKHAVINSEKYLINAIPYFLKEKRIIYKSQIYPRRLELVNYLINYTFDSQKCKIVLDTFMKTKRLGFKKIRVKLNKWSN